MPINPKTPGIHHISLRCRDMGTTKQFYQSILGLNLAYDSPTLMGFLVVGFYWNPKGRSTELILQSYEYWIGSHCPGL